MPHTDRQKYLEYQRQYSKKNRKLRSKNGLAWYHKNKEIVSKIKKEKLFLLKQTPEKYQEYLLEKNRKRRIYSSKRYKENIEFKLQSNIRNRTKKALKNQVNLISATRNFGCSISELKVHLEKQFKPGMSWDNYGHGKNKWNVDHIKPLSSFKLEEPQKYFEACHYTNLQPLWHEENIKKSNKIET